MKKIATLFALLFAINFVFAQGTTITNGKPASIQSGTIVKTTVKPSTTTPVANKPSVVKDTSNAYVVIKTSLGDITILLYNETPLHRDNFIKLVEQSYYDGTLFHRVIKEFMIQGGDPDSKTAVAGQQLGNGGPNYTIPAEFNPKFFHKKGALAAARQPDQVNPKKESSGSQFYIVQGKKYTDAELAMLEAKLGIKFSAAQKQAYKEVGGTPFLDMNYTVFGKVVYGMSVIDKIAAVVKDKNDRPISDIKMSVSILHKPKSLTKPTTQVITKPTIKTMDTTATYVLLSTEYGDMKIKLYNETPQHRDNFIKLASSGYYDGTIFHRVIQSFMIQGGDPDSKNAQPGQRLGMGGPSYTVPAEFNPNFIHKKGALSAARTGDAMNPQKASSGSQFYIVQGKKITAQELTSMESMRGMKYTEEQKNAYMEVGGTPFLDTQYTVYGEVVEGLDVIDKIAAVQKDSNDRPTKDIKMTVKVL
jgi:cyclophilin family peptidyl-prolyl cis-trans isomerase